MTRRIAVDFDLAWRPHHVRRGMRVFAILLVIVTAACSAGTPATKSQASAAASGLAQTGPFTAPEAIGLKIYSKPWNFGIHCPLWADRHSLVVLASRDRDFLPDEVNRLTAYGSGHLSLKPGVVEPPALPADLLREVNGTLTSASVPLKPGTTGWGFGPTCAYELELTNLGTAAMQVTKAGVRQTGRSEANQTIYRLIDICSLAGNPDYCTPGIGGGPTPCGFFVAAIELRDSNPGTLSQQPPWQIINDIGETPADTQCPALVINPAQTVDLRVDLWSARNLVFPVEPLLTVATSAGEKLVTVADQAGRAAFANATQFTCMKFLANANMFVQAYEGVAALDLQKQSPNGNWCI